MKLTDNFVKIWTITVLVVIGSIWVHAGLIAYNHAHPSGVSAFDGTVACQQIASQATNSGWSYSNCLKELQKAIAPQAVSYKT